MDVRYFYSKIKQSMPTCNKNRSGNASSGNSENPPSDGQAAPHKAHARPHRLAHLEEGPIMLILRIPVKLKTYFSINAILLTQKNYNKSVYLSHLWGFCCLASLQNNRIVGSNIFEFDQMSRAKWKTRIVRGEEFKTKQTNIYSAVCPSVKQVQSRK